MKAIFSLAASLLLTLSAFAQDGSEKKTVNLEIPKPDRISLYEVPLVCGAAPQIGCGGRAKPVLTELESDPSVSEAWLNRTGTLLTVVWTEKAAPASRATVIKSVSDKRNVTMNELKDGARETALKDFLLRQGWYRGTAVDRLSEEEADIIAARLVRRIKTNVSLSDEKANALKLAFASLFKQNFIRNSANQEKTTQKQIEEELLKTGRNYLDESGVKALQQAIALGYRPQPNEQEEND